MAGSGSLEVERSGLSAGAFVVGCALATFGLWMIVRVAGRGERLFTNPSTTVPVVLFGVGVGVAGWYASTPPDARPSQRASGLRPVAAGALGVALAAWGAGVIMVERWPVGHRDAVVATVWLTTMVALLVGAAGRLPPRMRDAAGMLRSTMVPSRSPTAMRQWIRTGLPEFSVFAAALVVRTVALDRYPYIVDGDGAAFAVQARRVGDELTDPFTTGYLDHPTLFAFAQRAVMWMVRCEGLAAARLTSALAGTGAVMMTYLFARRIAGRKVGLVSAALLALMPMHIFYSRVALNNVFDSLFLPASLWLVDRAFGAGRRTEAVCAGLCVGLAQYFYFGSRLLVPVVVVYVVFQMWQCASSGDSLGASARLIGWGTAGLAVAYTPLGLHYLAEPHDFDARVDSVAFFGTHLRTEQAVTGHSAVTLVARQFGQTFALPFSDAFSLAGYSPQAPMIGWIFAIPAAIGLGVVTVRPLRRRHFPLTVVWWLSLAAVAFTVNPGATRWVIATPIVAITAAVGLDATFRSVVGSRSGAWPRIGSANVYDLAVSAFVVAAFLGGTVRHFATIEGLDDNGDLNSLVATELGHRLAELPPDTMVIAVFQPRMGLRTHATIELLAPERKGIDVLPPMSSVDDVPVVDGPTVFAFLPERLDELRFVQAKYPNGSRDDLVRFGEQILVTYLVAS